jgi:hypothetical protein
MEAQLANMEKQKRPAFMKPVPFGKEISVGASKIYELVRQNKIPHVLIDGMIRIPSDVLDHLKQQAMANVTTDAE